MWTTKYKKFDWEREMTNRTAVRGGFHWKIGSNINFFSKRMNDTMKTRF